MVLCLLHVTSAVAPLLASKLLRRTARSAVGLQYGNYESVQGVGYESPQGYLEQPVLALDGAVGVTGFAYSMQAHDRYLHLPYVLRLGEEQVLSRWNMVRQKLTVSREQCKVAVAADGAALLLSTGRGPTMWRSRAASEWPCGPWNALYSGQVRVIEDGDQLSLDCNDPDDAVLFVADSKTGAMKALTAGEKGRVDTFSWKSNDSVLAAMSFGVDSKLMNVSVGGKLTAAPSDPQLNYLGVDVAKNGAVAVVADSATHPRELFYNGKRLTDSNPWLKSRQLAKQSVVKYKARDGLEIEGLLISPLNASGPAPTILTVHGGPESHYDDGWLTYYSLPGQVAAAKGYAVFYPNYRGSTGRGVEYAKSSQGDPAGKEFEDLIDAVDYLIEAGVTAKDKVGVTGGSYGGYATAWLTTRYTDRFAAGVMFVGISDKISKVGTTDIPDEEYLVHARKRPWDAWEFFAERSPIRYVEQARTPLLIMHGKEDPRVHPTQSMELFRFLKVLDQTPVRLVLYPGEGHGNRNAAARYDYNLRMLRWFDTYLMNSGAEKPEVEIDYQLPDSE